MNFDPLAAAIGFGILLISLTIHEAAHAWTADRLGDPTARRLGRVSLNPLVHIDWIGTVLLPIIAAVSNLPLIGWAKPVPVSVGNLRHPRRDFMLVAAAGPISNLLQAIAWALVLRVILAAPDGDAAYFLQRAVIINLLLMFFNLIPIPPLDGGNVLLGLLPPQLARHYSQLRQYGFLILYALMLSGYAARLILPPTAFLYGVLVK
ncbi:MAG TPA: site-2 protease family protein [Vicinamibacterales bacterium]|nr:site-2 protease family protein [Vicinamibacterales bacterium]